MDNNINAGWEPIELGDDLLSQYGEEEFEFASCGIFCEGAHDFLPDPEPDDCME